MLTRSKIKLEEGELVETNPEIGRLYSQNTMSEEDSVGPEPQFIESFLAIKSMVEECTDTLESKRWKKHQALSKRKNKMSVTSMKNPKERGKRKTFSHLLIAFFIIRKHL